MALTTDWQPTDSWLFYITASSAGLLNTGVSLKKIVYSFDAMNRDVFSTEDIQEGAARLIAIDYIRIADGNFFVTKRGADYYNSISRAQYFDAVSLVHQHLQEKFLDIRELIPITADIISDAMVKQAYQENSDEFDAMYAKLKVEEPSPKLSRLGKVIKWIAEAIYGKK